MVVVALEHFILNVTNSSAEGGRIQHYFYDEKIKIKNTQAFNYMKVLGQMVLFALTGFQIA